MKMMEQQMLEIPFTQTDAIPQLPVESELFIIADHLSDEQQIREFIEVHGADDWCLKYMSDRIKRIFG